MTVTDDDEIFDVDLLMVDQVDKKRDQKQYGRGSKSFLLEVFGRRARQNLFPQRSGQSHLRKLRNLGANPTGEKNVLRKRNTEEFKI